MKRILTTNLKFLNLNKYNLNKNLKKFTFASVFNPNSLLFKQKRQLERFQKQTTRMNTPENLTKIKITDDIDFEPSIDYFGHSEFVMKVNERPDKAKEHLTEAFLEDGFVQLIIPFDKDIKLRNSYRLLHYERMRTGKMLEILDYLTAFTAYRYNNVIPKSKQATMVTAGLDEIELYRDVNLNKRLILNSYVTWTGESSMEVRVDLYNQSDNGNNNDVNNDNDNDSSEEDLESDEAFLGSATFVYVIRDAKDYSNKRKVATLNLSRITDIQEKQKALLRQEIGAENKKIRLKKNQMSLFKSPPSQEESAILHEQFVSYKRNKDLLLQQYSKGVGNGCNLISDKIHIPNVKTINETRIEKSILMHSQNMNVNGHVFGGYIMREAMELGYVCAYLHSNKENPSLISVDSVTFHKPVIIGSIAQFFAHVTLVHEELLHVCVEVFNIVDTQAAPFLTTTINITYKTKSRTQRVYPTTYECGVKYLEAKRIVENLFNIF